MPGVTRAHSSGGMQPARRCACGGIVGPTGECAACRAKRLGHNAATTPAPRPSAQAAGPGHSFAGIQVHTGGPAPAATPQREAAADGV
jgi:hypothetical protein